MAGGRAGKAVAAVSRRLMLKSEPKLKMKLNPTSGVEVASGEAGERVEAVHGSRRAHIPQLVAPH